MIVSAAGSGRVGRLCGFLQSENATGAGGEEWCGFNTDKKTTTRRWRWLNDWRWLIQ